MSYPPERRREKRVRLFWPLWLGYEENGQLIPGQMADLSRSGIAFTLENQHCPPVGTHLFTRFSYPDNLAQGFEMGNYCHWSEVIRVDPADPGKCRIAMRLHQPLQNEPAETIPTVCAAMA